MTLGHVGIFLFLFSFLLLVTRTPELEQGEDARWGHRLGAELLINVCSAVNIWGMLL